MKGTLIYDPQQERLAITNEHGITHLHCGDYIEIERFIIAETEKRIWLSARVEYAYDRDDWYLAGLYAPGQIPAGLTARTEF